MHIIVYHVHCIVKKFIVNLVKYNFVFFNVYFGEYRDSWLVITDFVVQDAEFGKVLKCWV